MSTCIVFVCDENYFEKFTYTYHLLMTKGEYTGDVCLVVDDTFWDSDKLEAFTRIDRLRRRRHNMNSTQKGLFFCQPFSFPSLLIYIRITFV